MQELCPPRAGFPTFSAPTADEPGAQRSLAFFGRDYGADGLEPPGCCCIRVSRRIAPGRLPAVGQTAETAPQDRQFVLHLQSEERLFTKKSTNHDLSNSPGECRISISLLRPPTLKRPHGRGPARASQINERDRQLPRAWGRLGLAQSGLVLFLPGRGWFNPPGPSRSQTGVSERRPASGDPHLRKKTRKKKAQGLEPSTGKSIQIHPSSDWDPAVPSSARPERGGGLKQSRGPFLPPLSLTYL